MQGTQGARGGTAHGSALTPALALAETRWSCRVALHPTVAPTLDTAPALRVWQNRMLAFRGRLRARGVRGPLRRLDDYIAGRRGLAYVTAVASLSAYLRSLGPVPVPPDELLATLDAINTDVVYEMFGLSSAPDPTPIAA